MRTFTSIVEDYQKIVDTFGMTYKYNHKVARAMCHYFARAAHIGYSLVDVLGWWPQSWTSRLICDTEFRADGPNGYISLYAALQLPTMGLPAQLWVAHLADIRDDAGYPFLIPHKTTFHESYTPGNVVTDRKILHQNADFVSITTLYEPEFLLNKFIKKHLPEGCPSFDNMLDMSCSHFEDRISLDMSVIDIPYMTVEGGIFNALAMKWGSDMRNLRLAIGFQAVESQQARILDNLKLCEYTQSSHYTTVAHAQIRKLSGTLDSLRKIKSMQRDTVKKGRKRA